MDRLFYTQLLTSFFVGGGFIAFMTFLAERVRERAAGIILAFPTTAALGFFFLGWTTSAQTVADVVPTTLIPFGISILFTILYIKLAQRIDTWQIPKLLKISVTFLLSISVWFVFSLPAAAYSFSNLWVGILFTLISICVAQYTLNRLESAPKPPTPRYTTTQKLFRALFVGLIISFVVLFAKILNPFWGAIFTMFPAAFSSTLMIFHWYYSPKELIAITRTIPIGTLSILAFVLVSIYTFPSFGFVWGTLLSYLCSLVVTLLLLRVQKSH